MIDIEKCQEHIEYTLLPYEVIEKAVAGERKAVNTIIRHHTDYINIFPIFKGVITMIYTRAAESALNESILQVSF